MSKSSVAKPASRHCPLLVEQDLLGLSSTFAQTTSLLYDRTTEIQHTLYGAGTILVNRLQYTIQYEELTILARHHDVSDTELRSLLGYLNKIGALQVKRNAMSTLRVWWVACQHLLVGVAYSRICFRVSADISSLVIATSRATTPVLLAIGVAATLSWVAGFTTLKTIILLALGGYSIFVSSIVLHESAHVFVLRRSHTAVDILQVGTRLGLIHRKASRNTEILSAVIGPITGCLLCLVVGFLGRHILWITVYSLLVSALHILSLLPWYGDGMSLTKAILRKD